MTKEDAQLLAPKMQEEADRLYPDLGMKWYAKEFDRGWGVGYTREVGANFTIDRGNFNDDKLIEEAKRCVYFQVEQVIRSV